MRTPLKPYITSIVCAFLLFAERMAAECLPGCLKCSSTGTCIQCDTASFYFTVSGMCQKRNLSTCVTASTEGTCLRCSSTSYLSNNNCTQIDKADILLGCVEYLSKSSCKVCTPQMYIDGSKCSQIKATISNCEVHTNNGNQCEKCVKGAVLSADQTACIKPTAEANCFSYTNIGCAQCKSGFYLSPRKYHIDVLRATDKSQKLNIATLNRIVDYVKANYSLSYEGSCIQTDVSNCLEYSDYNGCSKCQSGYYLTSEKKCLAFPREPVPFCEIYSNSTTCVTCQNKFYMSDFNVCSPVTEILNCDKYSRTSDKVCLQCVITHYTDQASCTPRAKSQLIASCQTLDDFADLCLECNDGSEINFDGTACVASVPFCLVYLKSSTAFNCTQCQDYYYLDSGKCLKSTAKNCRVVAGLETCTECENGFFLNGTACSPHPLKTALNCNVTKSSSMNECAACSETYVKIPLDGMCTPVTSAINNCYRYSTASTCDSCNPRTSFAKDGLCRAAFIDNCTQFFSTPDNSCKTCKADYNKKTIYVPYPKSSSYNHCVPGDPNIIENCMLYDVKDDVEFCSVCLNKYYPFNMPTANLIYCVPKDFYLLPTQASLLIDCLVYNPKTGKCVTCAGTKIIGTDGICTTECKTGEFLYAVTHGAETTDVSFKSLMECSATNPSLPDTIFYAVPLDCSMIVESSTESEFLCGGCSASQIGAINWTKDQSKASLLAYQPIPNLVRYSYYNRITVFQNCLSKQVTYSDQTTTTTTRVVKLEDGTLANLDNCRIIALIGSSDRYGCVACRFGYSGLIVKDFDSNGYFIKKCELIPSCQATDYINGLGSLDNQLNASPVTPPMDFFVSCHLCSDQKIPTFVRTLSALTDVTPNIKTGFFGSYGFPVAADTVVPYKKTPANGMATSCQTSGLGKVFVSNCAIQEVAMSRLLQDYLSTSTTNNPLCVACAPGYKATMQGTTRIISACTKIENCLPGASITFNKCSQCAKGFALKYDSTAADGQTKYEECVASPNNDFNCLIASTETTPSTCVVCAAGYVKNADGVCDAVFTYKCQRPGFYQKMSKKAMRSLSFPYSGCAQCSSDAIGILFEAPKKICVLSSQIFGSLTLASSTFVISNCQFYTLDKFNNVICYACEADYVISISSTKCFKSILRIKNCEAYTNDGLNCGRCSKGFYQNQVSLCILGEIPNCVTYSSEKRCEVCAPEFLAIEAEGGRLLCFSKPQINCQDFHASSLAVGILSCKLCDANFYYEKAADKIGKLPLSYCAPVPQVKNCARYNNLNDVASAKLTCLACIEGFYWSGSECLTRTRLTVANCNQLSEIADGCATCNSGYTKESNGLCAQFPDGISGCESYKNNKVCQQCKPMMFLADNRCLLVPTESLINDCLYYDSQLKCLQCKTNFYNSAPTKCEEAKATNCLKFQSLTVCASCPVGYGIVRDKETTSCLLINVSNCIEPDYTIEGPNFKCKTCATSFYLATDKTCIAVPKIIDHCALYLSSTECSLCFEGYVLSQDQKTCLNDQFVLSKVDGNCLNSYILQKPVCNICNSKFYFAKNSTSGSYSCQACDTTLTPGCLLCDPTATSKCILCQPGYYQKEDMTCELSEAVTTPIIIQSDSSVVIALVQVALLSLLILNNL